jgi:membrane fusion protein (multidrug efflux system)
VNVSVAVGTVQQYLTLPQAAVTYNPYGVSVFVIKPVAPAKPEAKSEAPGTLRVQQQFVETGPQRGDQVAILKGLAAGDLVVTSGQLKLKNGAAVVVNNSVTPPNEPQPNPANE